MTTRSDSIWRRQRFEITLAVAALGHVALLSQVPAQSSRPPAPRQTSLDIDLLAWVEDELAAPVARPGTAEPGEPLDPSAPTARAARSQPLEPVAMESEAPTEATGSEDELSADSVPLVSQPAPARKGVRLFLGQSELAEMTRGASRRSRAAKVPDTPPASVGRLTEGLHELDAEKGLSGSSPAVSASYRAARLGPNVGTAVFEIRTDARGAVTAVQVVGDDTNGAWSNVAADLLARLKDRLLRLPAGAKGLVTRLRIDRGELAQDLSERGRTKRGVAIGQEHHPKDLGWDESTQGSLRPNRLSPTLGISSEDLRTSVKTRVQLLSQQTL
jgi:hypothetical protein